MIDNLVDSSILDQYRNLYKVIHSFIYPFFFFFSFSCVGLLSLTCFFIVKQSRESGKVVQADIHDPFRKTYNHVTISTISYDRESQISKYNNNYDILSYPSLSCCLSYCCRHVYMVADKTQQRLTEIELERYKDSLKEKVQQRTLEVQEKELQYVIIFIIVYLETLINC